MRIFYSAFALAFVATMTWAKEPVNDRMIGANHDGVQTVMKAADTALPDPSELISEQPEGTLYKNMYRSANLYVAVGSATTNRSYDGYAGDMVVSNDGKRLYVKDPFIKLAPGTWIVGDLDENGIVEFHFPQVIYNKGGIIGYAWKMNISSDGIVPDADTQTVKFKWADNKLTQVTPSDVIGMTDANQEWMGYGAAQSEYAVVTDLAANPTDESKADTYKMTYYDLSGNTLTATLKVLVDGSDIYIGGIQRPEFWMKGTISGTTASFPAQYLGVNGSTHAYMMPFNPNTYQFMNSLDFTYDAAKGTLACEQALEVNIGKVNMSALNMYVSPSLVKTTYAAGKPATPVITYVMEYNKEDENLAAVIYQLSNLSADGQQMDQDKLFFNIYLDGELQTFSPSAYDYLKADMTDVPYAYADSYTNMFTGEKGFDFVVKNGCQLVYLYRDFRKVGVKAIYVDGDTRTESDMAEWLTSGVRDLPVDDADGQVVAYYDLSGRKVNRPEHGLYLKAVRHADGSVHTVKVKK